LSNKCCVLVCLCVCYHPSCYHPSWYHLSCYHPSWYHLSCYHLSCYHPSCYHPSCYHLSGYHPSCGGCVFLDCFLDFFCLLVAFRGVGGTQCQVKPQRRCCCFCCFSFFVWFEEGPAARGCRPERERNRKA
uniref:Secreted protein n=1 Tax=Pundamilia nyererei TaxID=303518 RepID=A0A3B4G6X5_9CICH